MVGTDDGLQSAALRVSANGAALMCALVGALIERTWPGVHAIIDPGTGEALAGEVLVRNASNGRTLSVFHHLTPSAIRDRLAHADASAVAVDAPLSDLERGLAALRCGPPFVSAAILTALAEDDCTGHASLTRRERDVLALVVSGYSNREMAALLHISPNTVRTHLQSVSTRLGVSSRGKLAARATELGLA